MGRISITLRRTVTGIAVVAGLAIGIAAMPPPLREIAVALSKAIVIAVAAYILFVALSMRGNP